MADNNADLQNELNFLVWKRDHARRRQLLRTQFNMWRERQHDRMCNHHLYKTESNEQTDDLREMLSQRLEQACSCDTCRSETRSMSIASDGSGSSSIRSRSSSNDSSASGRPSSIRLGAGGLADVVGDLPDAA